MTAYVITSPAPVAPRAGFGWQGRTVHDWNKRRITRREIARLDAHLLCDIGITPPPADPGVELLRKAQVSW